MNKLNQNPNLLNVEVNNDISTFETSATSEENSASENQSSAISSKENIDKENIYPKIFDFKDEYDEYYDIFSSDEKRIVHRLEIDIIREIENNHFEDGFIHPAEEIIKGCFIKHPSITKKWLLQTLLRNYKYPEVVVAILKTISDFDISLIDPECKILCVASLSHKNHEIRETVISVFETWATPDLISFLKDYNENVPWLDDYRKKVIAQIEAKHGILS